MHDPVAHADYLAPRQERITVGQLAGDPRRSLAEHLDQVGQNDLQVLVTIETLSTPSHSNTDLVGGLEGVGKAFPIVPHTATASVRIRSRILNFSPPTVATWVNTPRSSSTASANPAMSK